MKAADEAIILAKVLGDLGNVLRVTKLPNGDFESDTHHSFSLALIAYDLVTKYAPQLDASKVLLYALVHDLLEVVTGDENTLFTDTTDQHTKRKREKIALSKLEHELELFPALLAALHRYEKRVDEEALVVYWLDKASTVWTHFYDNGANLRNLGIRNRADIDLWYERLMKKLTHDAANKPPQIIQDILQQSFIRMREDLLND